MKKIILILVMFLLTLTSCSKERIEDMSKLEARDGIIYVKGEDKPYTGTFIEKYENGNLKETLEVQDGILHGEKKSYYKNGQLSFSVMVANRWNEGVYKIYYESGNLKSDGFYMNGRIEGWSIRKYKDDKIIEKTNYEKEREVDISKLGEKYKMIYMANKHETYTGMLVEKYSNGNLKETLEVQGGAIHGENKRYYENGQLSFNTMIVRGWNEGPYKTYYENGNLRSEGFYKKGKIEGFERTYHENGQLWSETEYKDEKIIGKTKWYDENGNPKPSL